MNELTTIQWSVFRGLVFLVFGDLFILRLAGPPKEEGDGKGGESHDGKRTPVQLEHT